MPQFFPSSEAARTAREVYKDSGLAHSLAVFDPEHLATPRARDWRDMIEEYCGLLETLGVPDRSGADIAVIVPFLWQGAASSRSISLDIGKRSLAFAQQPDSRPREISDEVFVDDPDLAKNLRDALVPAMVSYKNQRPRDFDSSQGG